MANELGTPLPEISPCFSFIKVCFKGINIFLGFGLLTIPYALARGGWFSLFLFFLIAIISFYTAIWLKKYMFANPSVQTYIDIVDHAFGRKVRILVMIITNLELYLIATGLLILEGDNLHKLFPKFALKLRSIVVDGSQSFVVITALVILPSMLLTDLLSYVSASGVFSCLLIFCSIIYVGAIEGVGFNPKGKLLNIEGVPTATSLYLVCFGGHPVIPFIYTSMQHKDKFNKVLLVSFVIATITYVSTAVAGYLMYGDSLRAEITLNLPTREVATKVAIYSTLLIPITKYALIIAPVATTIEDGLPERYKNWGAAKLFIKIALLVSTTFMAFIFPCFENVMAIVGSIFIVLVSFVVPCLCYLKAFRQNWSYKLIAIIVIIISVVILGALGTYSSISKFAVCE